MTWTPPYQINYASDGDTVYGAVVKCDNNIADAYAKLTILDTYRTEDHADISQATDVVGDARHPERHRVRPFGGSHFFDE